MQDMDPKELDDFQNKITMWDNLNINFLLYIIYYDIGFLLYNNRK